MRDVEPGTDGDEDDITPAERRRRRAAKYGGEMHGTKPPERLDKRKRGGKLTAVERKAMPSKDFALPGKGSGPEGKGSGSYPIPDEGHARAALSRAAANASPAEQAEIKRKVHEKFPDIHESK